MSAVIQRQSTPTIEGIMQLKVMDDADLTDVVAIENTIYPSPWTRGNFHDSLVSGYQCRVLRDESNRLLGYFLMMLLVDEVHLLNISVRADLHGRGLGQTLLGHVTQIAQAHQMGSILLEVRPSNRRALAVYERYGFTRIGLRKHYYPAEAGQREDAIVMRLIL